MANKIDILLDAGHHGKYNESPAVDSYYESDFAWKYHLLLKKELEKYGFNVGVTRKNQGEKKEATERGKMAKGHSLALSLHSNASSDIEKDRVKIYFQVEDDSDGKHARESKNLAEFLAPIINKVMECKGEHSTASRKSELDRDCDGSKDDYYGFLRGSAFVRVPALIIEHSYHTNKRATEWLLDDNNLELLAKETAFSLAVYYDFMGDVNGDGKINSADYIMAKRIVLGTYSPSTEEFNRCDINKDGEISASDYLRIKRLCLNNKKGN